MTVTWGDDVAGVCELPSGQLPSLGVYLLGRQPSAVDWDSRWIRWPDFWLPSDRVAAVVTLREALDRSAGERVEIACSGGNGRTGTAMAMLAVLDGVPPERAVEYVRVHYSRHAVETPWQRRFIAGFHP